MEQNICARIKLKPGSIPRVREWAARINTDREEALVTLRDEGVQIESVFLDKINDVDYLVYYMKVVDIDHANEVAKRSRHAIDLYHNQFKRDCWEEKMDLELLINLEV